jgi:predicted SprT family Zn-dependent metalloprotease
MKPTLDNYNEWQAAYDHFNAELFGGKLPECLITLQREKRTYGYFCKDRFESRETTTDEIAMNPKHFGSRTTEETLSTLVHEMAHLWQRHFGKPGRRAYHNREWADKMIALGLHPSSTAQEGGDETGEKVSHYIVRGGAFDLACKKLLTKKFRISWGDRIGEEKEETVKAPKQTRSKYVCSECEAAVWGKPGMNLSCDDCDNPFEEAA